jgi:hypothetical protein
MSLLFMDSFDHYAIGDLTKKWNSVGSLAAYRIDVTSGRRGSGAVNGNYGQYRWGCTRYVTTNEDRFFYGVAWNSGTSHSLFLRVGGAGGSQVELLVNADLGISVYRGTESDVLLGKTADGLLSTGVWYFIEWSVLLHGSIGTVVVRVNNAIVLSLTNQNTLSSATTPVITNFHMSLGWSAVEALADDLYFCDDAGAVNNDFLGDVRVDAHFPVTPDGANHAWTPSTGSDNFAMVDEVTPNITDYNATSTLNAVDTFHHEDFKNAGGTILGVQLNLYHSKSDAGACLIAPVVLSDATTSVGADIAPSAESWAYGREIREVDPDGTVAWTEGQFNAAEFGYKKTG